MPLPGLLLSALDSEVVRKLLKEDGENWQVSFTVREDTFPRVPLKRVVKQNVLLVLSGVWILYGGLRLGKIKVGAEFVAAMDSAHRRSIPCECCDLSLDSL